MIISHKHKFIFMHSRKCAGSSMEVMLNKHLGPNDIQIGSWPETILAGGSMNKRAFKDALFYRPPWRSTFRHLSANIIRRRKLDLSQVVNASIKRKYRKILGVNPSCPIAQSVIQLDPAAWGDYFKFSFVRNPFDFEVSDYFWRTKGLPRRVEFKDFLRRKLDSGVEDPEGVVPFPPTNWPIYAIDNQVALDYVGRFEELNEHVYVIGDRLGLSLDLNSVPKAKSGIRKKIDPSEFYDKESKEMVSLLHKHEIEVFGYEFPF